MSASGSQDEATPMDDRESLGRIAGSNSATTITSKPHPLEHPAEWVLRLFGEVRPGEVGTVLLLSLNVFLLLTAYYLLKVAREPLILLHGGAEVKSYAAVGQSILLIGVASAYGWLATRVSRRALITSVTLFFAIDLVVFWGLGTRGVPLGIPFFLWVGIYNLVTVAQFWGFAAEIYTEEQGRRLFPIVGMGSSIGAVLGAVIASRLVKRGSPFLLMVVAAAILLSTLALYEMVYRRQSRSAAKLGEPPVSHAPLDAGSGFTAVARDRYLLLIALMIFILNIVTRTGDYVLDRLLLAQGPAEAHALGVTASVYIGQFKARYFEWINVLGVVLQSLFVSRVIRYGGIRVALALVSLASLGGYGASAVAPVIGVLFIGRIVESSLDYSLSNTTRQALWLPTSPKAKYKAKQVIDTFVVRTGDAFAAGLVWLGAMFAIRPHTFIVLNVGLSALWVVTAWYLGREHAHRSEPTAFGS
jgi:AAA family ATP:ADP antiporter